MIQFNDANKHDLLTKMYENSMEAIFFINNEGEILGMNPAAENILDLDVIEGIHKGNKVTICQTCVGYTNEEATISCINCFVGNTKEDFSSFQVYLNTRGQGIVPYAASFHTIDEAEGVRVFMLLNLTKQYRTQEKLYKTNMTKYVIKAQEDERKRISRELHDSVAQELLSSLVDLRVLKYINADDAVLNKLKQTEASLTRLLDDIRHMAVELRPASLDDFGLEAAFRSHFKWIDKNYGLVVDFITEISSARYSNEIETVVYRICQEAVLNALKYANTDEIHVRLFEDDGDLQLIVEDKGAGFHLNTRDPKGTGLGLFGMRERAELVHGQLMIKSEVGAGTTIHLRIPLPPIRSEEGVNE